MFRPENVNARDLELLSASLDNALSVQEQLEFKKRLAESSHLNTLLAEQRQLKRAMQALPARKLPHNFTLTRAEAQKAKRGSFLQPVFGWASAISALVLMVVFGSEFIFNNYAAAPVDQAIVPEVAFVEEAPPENAEDLTAGVQLASADENIYLLNWNGGIQAGGMGGMGGGDATSSQTATHGVSLNISVAKIDVIEPVEGEVDLRIGEEATPIDAPLEQNPEAYGGGSMVEEVSPLPTETPEEDRQNLEAPLILGIDSESLGQVIGTSVIEDKPVELKPAPEAAELAEEDIAFERISSTMKWALLGATVLLGLIWVVLKFKK